MVNRFLPYTVASCLTCVKIRESGRNRRTFDAPETPQRAALRAFAQILGKLYFVQLRENLRRILLDYGQKRRHPANAAFNAAC
jgi:hypothetical protein